MFLLRLPQLFLDALKSIANSLKRIADALEKNQTSDPEIDRAMKDLGTDTTDLETVLKKET